MALSRKLVSIQDHLLNPTFYEPRGTTIYGKSVHLNRWCNFWNLLGARSSSQKPKYICVICEVRVKKTPRSKYRVCSKHRNCYINDIKMGRVRVPATFEVYAIA